MKQILEEVISCQERLIAALDARDVLALEDATAELETALGSLKASGAVYKAAGARLDFALRQSGAARIRVNVLADWTRQRIDQVTEIRSGEVPTFGTRLAF